MLDDSAIRRMVLATIPDIDPSRFEVCMMDYDATIGWWLRKDDGTKDHGRVAAIQRTERELAVEIASDIAAKRCGTIIENCEVVPVFDVALLENCAAEAKRLVADLPLGRSPYEGKGGRHPNNCTCSKHQ